SAATTSEGKLGAGTGQGARESGETASANRTPRAHVPPLAIHGSQSAATAADFYPACSRSSRLGQDFNTVLPHTSTNDAASLTCGVLSTDIARVIHSTF